MPYKRTKLEGERLALEAAREGAEVIVVNPTVPVGPGDLRPTPTGKMVADVARGRARAYLARSALNIVAVEDVARGHVLAFERGRAGERYLLGGDNMTVREVFAVDRTGGRTARAANARAVDRRLRERASSPTPRSGRWAASRGCSCSTRYAPGRLPHLFDDAKARAELGYASRPAVDALAEAARSALAAHDDSGTSAMAEQPIPTMPRP